MDTKIRKGTGNNILSIINEIANTLKTIHYGSMEIIVQDGRITQISTRHISKTNFSINPSENEASENSTEKNNRGIKIRIGY